MVEIITQFLKNNNCYKAGRKIDPVGIVIHSTGANNPNLRRYVPGDDDIGYNEYNNDWDTPNPDGDQKCVHAFIGKKADGKIAVVQTLPWDMRCWGCGSGNKGSYNDTRIQFEICEDDLNNYNYWLGTKNAAVQLCAYLCNLYNIDTDNITDHQTAWSEGYASNHSDVRHWWDRYGYSIYTFRLEVESELKKMEYNQFKAFMDQYMKEMRANKSVSDWAKDSWNQAKQLGITDGSDPKKYATREEVVTMIMRGRE